MQNQSVQFVTTKLMTDEEALVELGNRMKVQLAETKWTIERAKGMGTKEIQRVFGKDVKKDQYLKALERERIEREENLAVLKKLIGE